MEKETEIVFITGIILGALIGSCLTLIWRLLIEKKASDEIIKKIDSILTKPDVRDY